MNMLLVIASIIAMLSIVGVALYFLHSLYQRRKGANDASIDTPTFWQSPVINTPNFGPVTPVHFEWETNTSGHATVQDANGRLRTLSPVHEEELHVKNILPGIFGASRLEIDWLPKDYALREQERYASHAGMVFDAVHHKHKFDMAQTEAVTAANNIDLELEKKLEAAQLLLRANPAPRKQ
jgi:hypothetical protein